MSTTTGHRIFSTTVASVYALYVAKVEKKGRTQDELDAVVRWLTGFDEAELERHLAAGTTITEGLPPQRTQTIGGSRSSTCPRATRRSSGRPGSRSPAAARWEVRAFNGRPGQLIERGDPGPAAV